MPLLRNIAGFSKLGLLDEGSGFDTMKVLSEEGGGGSYGGGGTVFPVNPLPIYYDPVPIRPVYPVDPILPVGQDEVINDLPAPNEVQVLLPAAKPVKVLPLLAIASAVLAMTGLHPFKRVGSGVLFAGALAVIMLQLNKYRDGAPAGSTVVTQPNTL